MGSGITSGECPSQNAINISEEDVSRWLSSPGDIVIATIIIPITLCLGVITNSSFLFVLFRVPKIRSDTNIYLMHLALADLVYLCLVATYDIWSFTASLVAFHLPFVNPAECVSFFTVMNTGYFASIALVTMVSFERFFALCHPIKHLKIRGKRRTYKLVAICWLVGLAFSASTVTGFAIPRVLCLQWPDGEKYQGFPSMTTYTYCGPVQPWVRYYTDPLLNIPWLIAASANTYMYIRIIWALNKRRNMSGIDKHHQARKIRNQVAKMLVVNGAVFFICQTPQCLITTSFWICSLAQVPNPIFAAFGRAVHWVSLIPQYINSTVNPLIYSAVNSQYRAAFAEAFHCKAPHTKKIPVKSPFTLSTAENTSSSTTRTSTNNENNETRL